MYTPLAIANTIVTMKPGFNALWLNKGVYLVHGWSLAFGRSILGEMPSVWRYGPVYASLYEELRYMRLSPLNHPKPTRGSDTCMLVPETDEFARDVIKQVVESYGKYSASQMSAICHSEGTPWQLEAESCRYRVPTGHRLPEWRMKAYFDKALASIEQRRAA